MLLCLQSFRIWLKTRTIKSSCYLRSWILSLLSCKIELRENEEDNGVEAEEEGSDGGNNFGSSPDVEGGGGKSFGSSVEGGKSFGSSLDWVVTVIRDGDSDWSRWELSPLARAIMAYCKRKRLNIVKHIPIFTWCAARDKLELERNGFVMFLSCCGSVENIGCVEDGLLELERWSRIGLEDMDPRLRPVNLDGGWGGGDKGWGRGVGGMEDRMEEGRAVVEDR